MWKKKSEGLAMQLDFVLALVVITILTAIVLVGVKSFLDNQRIVKARADCAQIGAAISQYHMEIGELPKDMNDVKNKLTKTNGQYGPWLTRNPNDGRQWADGWNKSFVYKVSANGGGSDARSFVIYSLGVNKKDDGSNASTGIAEGDIGFWGK